MKMWLDDLKVVEVGTSPSVKFCGRMMAELGARVFDVSVGQSAELNEQNHRYLRHGKEVVAASGKAELQAATGYENFDIVIGDTDASIDLFDIDPARPMLRGVIDAFGASGPWQGWQGSEMIYSSLGGAAGYTLSASGTPAYGIGHRYQFMAGMYLHTALMALAHRAAQEPLLAVAQRQVRVSVYEFVVATMPYLPVQYFYNGSNRVDNHTGPRFVVRCRDGWVMTYLGPTWSSAAGMLEQQALVNDPRFSSTAAQFDNLEALEELVRLWGAGKTVAASMEAARKWDIAVTEILDMDSVMAQVKAGNCGTWHEVSGGLVPDFPVIVRNEGVAL